MINPWHKRANELIRDPLALLPLISPQPVRQFFSGDTSSLFDRFVVVIGSPGSGKTTLARLLEFSTLSSALDAHDRPEFKPLIVALNEAQVISDLKPRVLGVRLPANAQYRAIWELPYSEVIRHKLLRSLLQARTVLGWLRQLESERVKLEQIKILSTGVGEAERTAIFADSPAQFRELARETEMRIFKLLAALVPPAESELVDYTSSITYDPFGALSEIVVEDFRGTGASIELRPMLMIDDAHELHASQFQDLNVWLRNREVRIARWVLTRVDSISPSEFRRSQLVDEIESPLPGTTHGRDRLIRTLQGRDQNRQKFRAVASDIGKRYLAQLPTFSNKGIVNLSDALLDAQPQMLATDTKKLKEQVKTLSKEVSVSQVALDALSQVLLEKAPEDLRLGVTRILLHREAARTPQRSLFSGLADDEQEEDDTPKKIKTSVVTGAEIQLLHEFDRPFYYGFAKLADASNQNIEQFISLAGVLVDELETLIVRNKSPRLDAKRQHTALRARAKKIMNEWDFPYAPRVRLLVDYISARCLEITRRPSAPLGDGANAFGVPQEDLKLLDHNPDLAQIIHYALAYQAIVMVEEYQCKNKQWCLFELGGIPSISAGLTINRGGFVEGRLLQLEQQLGR